jgi:protein-S-isoprenylcysteine O-methyltransferase Ste14
MIQIGNNLNIVLFCWIILILYWVFSSLFVKKSVVKRNWLLTISSRILLTAVVILLYIFYRSATLLFLEFLFKSYFQFLILGSILTIIGLIGAIWARYYLGSNWGSVVGYTENHELITNGPYKYIRHPIYSSVILMFIGTFLYYGNLFSLVLIITIPIWLLWRVKKEEEIMIKLFDKKYKDYMKNSKRLIPGVY